MRWSLLLAMMILSMALLVDLCHALPSGLHSLVDDDVDKKGHNEVVGGKEGDVEAEARVGEGEAQKVLHSCCLNTY